MGTPQSRAPDATETRGVFVVSPGCCPSACAPNTVHKVSTLTPKNTVDSCGAARNATSSVWLVQDELSCIGCKQCVWIAPRTFRIEADHGRSRAFAQWADNEDDTQARLVPRLLWMFPTRKFAC